MNSTRPKRRKGRNGSQLSEQNSLTSVTKFAELKHEQEQAQLANNRSELLGRRGWTGGGSETPENPYSDASVAGGGQAGQNVNPLFRTNNPNFPTRRKRYERLLLLSKSIRSAANEHGQRQPARRPPLTRELLL